MRETKAQKIERAVKVVEMLPKMYKRRKTMLTWSTPWECLVAIQLSAQCTDKRVNIVTPGLFKALRSVEAFAEVPVRELEEMIRSTGFYRNKRGINSERRFSYRPRYNGPECILFFSGLSASKNAFD